MEILHSWQIAQEIMGTCYQSALKDDTWRFFQFKSKPKGGSIPQKLFYSNKKYIFIRTIKNEMILYSMSSILKYIFSENLINNRGQFIGYTFGYVFFGLGDSYVKPWESFMFTTQEEAFEYYHKGIIEYLNQPDETFYETFPNRATRFVDHSYLNRVISGSRLFSEHFIQTLIGFYHGWLNNKNIIEDDSIPIKRFHDIGNDIYSQLNK